MAAAIVLSFVVEEALGRVLSSITEEIKLLWGFNEELNRLQGSLSMIRDVLQDAEEQQVTQMAVRHWLMKLKDVAYDVEDVLDELAYQSLKVDIQNREETKVHNFFAFSRVYYRVKKTLISRVFHLKMAHKVKNVNETLDKIKNEAVGFGLRVISVDRMPRINSELVTYSIIDHPIVGREVNVSEIVNMMACFCNQQALTVIPIVGMGGLGKTALAKLVCQEVMERKFFDVKMWVCISDDFDDQRIVGEMWQTLNANAGGITNKGATLQHLERISRNNGKAVIVTTRSEEVASIMETSPQCRHKLKLLSDDECWSIIKERVCRNGRTSIPSDLEVTGKGIANRCGGLPLAARVLASTAFCKKWKFKSLRTLKLVVADIKELPTSIGELKHLRHLDASYNEIKVLPVLRLEGCNKCGEIPRLGHLLHLRCLGIRGMNSVKSIGNEFYGKDDERTSSGWRLFPALERFCLEQISSLV
ncbi:putative disease resistance protein RGA3 [Hevea brasiliensis]|uniref:putative disease resistance protein RGA3 n=1 Tax=Hevea brasiliensis TaxID=3981 RepID=UPI0025CD3EBF|nr:putative disease resistance protein RGA3 [Hevea brasiliensis]